MSFTIRDGIGSGKEAKVTSDNRLSTTAVTENEADTATSNGTRYNLNTGTVTLTNATTTTLFYIQNTEDKDLIITALIYNLGATTGGSGDVTIDIIRNPTAGDIITNANNIDINSNQNFGSNRSLSANVYKGATGETAVSGGETTISTLSASNTGRIFISLGAMTLAKGNSLAVNYTPPTGNTSQGIQVAVPCYVKTFDV